MLAIDRKKNHGFCSDLVVKKWYFMKSQTYTNTLSNIVRGLEI